MISFEVAWILCVGTVAIALASGDAGGESPAASDHYETTGESTLCLRRDKIVAVTIIDERKILLETKDGAYLNRMQSDCPRPANPLKAHAAFHTAGPMVCRNDKLLIWPGLGNNRSCTFSKFEELRPGSPTDVTKEGEEDVPSQR